MLLIVLFKAGQACISDCTLQMRGWGVFKNYEVKGGLLGVGEFSRSSSYSEMNVRRFKNWQNKKN